MIEFIVEVMRPPMLVLGTSSILISLGILISEQRHNRRAEGKPDHPERTDPEGER